jgi:hypothetical protein
MTLEERAASMSREEIVSLLKAYEELARQVEWFRRQLFGPKSERRLWGSENQQLRSLGSGEGDPGRKLRGR